MKRVILATAGAAALTLTAVALATAGRSGQTTIHVIEHANTDAVTDTGKKGDSAGDLLTFANPIFNQADSAKTGGDQGMCIRTVVGVAWECWWTTKLAGGQITVEGPFYDKTSSRLAITGGTGTYANTSGWMDLKARGTTKYDFVYHLAG
jgi:allene oxide cyclase